MSDASIIQFERFTLDLSKGALTCDGKPVRLRAKSFHLLCYIASNAGRVISKDELLERVWPHVVVTEDSLTQAVKEIRQALGSTGRDAIRTVSRRGYLFQPPRATPPASTATVAVLPFENAGSERDDDVLVDGITEEITHGLALFRSLAVLSRRSAFSFPVGTRPAPREIGERLGVDFLVEGSVCRRAGQLVLSVRLLHAAQGVQIWAQRFQAPEDQLFELQDTVAHVIINRLAARLDDARVQTALRKPTASLQAHEALLRGIALLRGYAPGSNEEACRLFELSCCLDPGYGLAHSYLSMGLLVANSYAFAPAPVLAKAADLAEKGLALAPEEPRCERILGYARLCRREYAAAEHHFERSLALNPYDADTLAQMGFLKALRGRPVEALVWMDRARRLNPIHPEWYHYDRSVPLYSLGEYAAAAAELEKVPRLGPWGLARLAACHTQAGEAGKAVEAMRKAKGLQPDFCAVTYARSGIAFEHAADLEHLLEGLVKAEMQQTVT